MKIDDIISLLEKYGTGGTLFIIFLFIILSVIKSDFFTNILSKISEKITNIFIKSKISDESKVRSVTESDIINHDIFNYIDFWSYSRIPTFIFFTDYRTVVFRKYLKIYLKSYKEKISKYINSRSYQTMDQAELSTSLIKLTNDIVFQYERESADAGIPRVVIDKMKVRNNDTILLTLDLIEGVCSSQFYESENNLLKVYSILNILLSVLESTISNSESVCNSINGQLKGLTFRDDGKDFIEP